MAKLKAHSPQTARLRAADQTLIIGRIDELAEQIEETQGAVDQLGEEIELIDGKFGSYSKVFRQSYPPPFYIKDNSYCKPGDIWVQQYRINILKAVSYVSVNGMYQCEWETIRPMKTILSSLPQGGILPQRNYTTQQGVERSYPNYITGDRITVSGTTYECTVTAESYGANSYVYSFTRIPTDDDTYTKEYINSVIGDVEALLSEV